MDPNHWLFRSSIINENGSILKSSSKKRRLISRAKRSYGQNLENFHSFDTIDIRVGPDLIFLLDARYPALARLPDFRPTWFETANLISKKSFKNIFCPRSGFKIRHFVRLNRISGQTQIDIYFHMLESFCKIRENNLWKY